MKRTGGDQLKTKQTKTEHPKVNIAVTAGTYETEQTSSSQPPFSHTERDNAPTKVPEPGGCTTALKPIYTPGLSGLSRPVTRRGASWMSPVVK